MRSCDNWIKPLANAITQTKNSTKFKAEVYFMGKEEGGRSGTIDSTYKPNIRFDKGTISSEIKFPDGSDQVYPGEHINLTITLELKTKIQKGKYFDIIENDKVIGFGIITELMQ